MDPCPWRGRFAVKGLLRLFAYIEYQVLGWPSENLQLLLSQEFLLLKKPQLL